MSNEKTTPGTKLNYMYGEMVSRYLTNLDDWVEYPSTHATALSYTNADGKEVLGNGNCLQQRQYREKEES